MKSSCVPRKTRPEQWCGLIFSVALVIDDDPFSHFLLVGMVWKGIFIDLLGPENKLYAFLLIRSFFLALTSDFSSWDICSACLFILLQNVWGAGSQSACQATVFLGEELRITNFWHPWPEGLVRPSPQAGASMNLSLLLVFLPRGSEASPGSTRCIFSLLVLISACASLSAPAVPKQRQPSLSCDASMPTPPCDPWGHSSASLAAFLEFNLRGPNTEMSTAGQDGTGAHKGFFMVTV